MLHDHRHLLLVDEALEVVPWFVELMFHDMRRRAVPQDTPGMREQIGHKRTLAGQLDFDGAVSETGEPASIVGCVVLLDDLDSLIQIEELDISIVGPARNAFHNDMNRLLVVVQDFGVASQESDDLGTRRGERNLTERNMLV